MSSRAKRERKKSAESRPRMAPESIRPRTGAYLEAVDLYKTYFPAAAPVPVLRGVNLSVKRGEFVAVEGTSGSGKSTLLHCLGLVDQPTAGAVFHKGQSLSLVRERERDRVRNRLFGFVFQFYHLLPELDALENVLLPEMIAHGMLRWPRLSAERREKAAQLLGRVGLEHRLHHRPSELSGGEQQRVAIARALANSPDIVLADEPTGNLDAKTGRGILELLAQLNAERNLTLVMVTHDSEVARRANRTLHLRDGVIQ